MNVSDFTKSIVDNATPEVFCAYSFLADLCDHNSTLFAYYKQKAARDGLHLQEFLPLPASEGERHRVVTDYVLQTIALMELKLDTNKIIGFIYNLNLGGH